MNKLKIIAVSVGVLASQLIPSAGLAEGYYVIVSTGKLPQYGEALECADVDSGPARNRKALGDKTFGNKKSCEDALRQLVSRDPLKFLGENLSRLFSVEGKIRGVGDILFPVPDKVLPPALEKLTQVSSYYFQGIVWRKIDLWHALANRLMQTGGEIGKELSDDMKQLLGDENMILAQAEQELQKIINDANEPLEHKIAAREILELVKKAKEEKDAYEKKQAVPPGAPSAPVTPPKSPESPADTAPPLPPRTGRLRAGTVGGLTSANVADVRYAVAPPPKTVYSRAVAACKNGATASNEPKVPVKICDDVKTIQEKKAPQNEGLMELLGDVVVTCTSNSSAGGTSVVPPDVIKRLCGGIRKWTPPASVVLTAVRKAIASIPSAAAVYKKLKPGDKKIFEQYLIGAKGCGYSKTQAQPLPGSGFELGKPSIPEMCKKIMDLIKKPKGVIQITEPTEAGMKKPEFIETKSPATQPATPATQPQAPTPAPADAPAAGGGAGPGSGEAASGASRGGCTDPRVRSYCGSNDPDFVHYCDGTPSTPSRNCLTSPPGNQRCEERYFPEDGGTGVVAACYSISSPSASAPRNSFLGSLLKIFRR